MKQTLLMKKISIMLTNNSKNSPHPSPISPLFFTFADSIFAS